MPGWAAGDDGWDSGVHHTTTTTTTIVLQSGDLVEDMSQWLVLRPPVQQVVPVITTSDLLLTVHNAETLYLPLATLTITKYKQVSDSNLKFTINVIGT